MCCGVSGAGDYTSTAWQRDLGEESNSLQLPLTCCALNNTHIVDSFLDPQPKDLRKCQKLESYAEGFRYSEVHSAEFFQYKLCVQSFQGCGPYLLKFAGSECVLLVGLCLGSSLLALIGLLISCYFFKQIKK